MPERIKIDFALKRSQVMANYFTANRLLGKARNDILEGWKHIKEQITPENVQAHLNYWLLQVYYLNNASLLGAKATSLIHEDIDVDNSAELIDFLLKKAQAINMLIQLSKLRGMQRDQIVEQVKTTKNLIDESNVDSYLNWYTIQLIYFESMTSLGISIGTIEKLLSELNETIEKE